MSNTNAKYTFVLNFLKYLRQAYLKKRLPEIDPKHYDTICETLTASTCEPNFVRRRRRFSRRRDTLTTVIIITTGIR